MKAKKQIINKYARDSLLIKAKMRDRIRQDHDKCLNPIT